MNSAMCTVLYVRARARPAAAGDGATRARARAVSTRSDRTPARSLPHYLSHSRHRCRSSYHVDSHICGRAILYLPADAESSSVSFCGSPWSVCLQTRPLQPQLCMPGLRAIPPSMPGLRAAGHKAPYARWHLTSGKSLTIKESCKS